MSFSHYPTIEIPSTLVMRGELKVAGNLRFTTNFTGKIVALGQLTVPAGVQIIADVKAQALRIEPDAVLRGKLEIGLARRPLTRLRTWLNKIQHSAEKADFQ